jgi:hypothetical protein
MTTKNDNCELCDVHLHSITLRRVGDHVYCIKCGDNIVLPYISKIIDEQTGFIKRVFDAHGYELTKQQFTP